MKKLMIGLVAFTSFAFADEKGTLTNEQNAKLCEDAYIKIADFCVNEKRLSCEDKVKIVGSSFPKDKIPDEVLEQSLKICSYYCENPEKFERETFLRECQKGEKVSKEWDKKNEVINKKDEAVNKSDELVNKKDNLINNAGELVNNIYNSIDQGTSMVEKGSEMINKFKNLMNIFKR